MIVFVVTLVLLADQATKAVLLRGAVRNSGVAFGIASQHSVYAALLLGVGLIGSIYLYATLSKSSRYDQLLWGSIFGGIVGNLIDRLRIGTVLDPFTLVQLRLSFNLADVAISVGCTLVCLQLLRRAVSK